MKRPVGILAVSFALLIVCSFASLFVGAVDISLTDVADAWIWGNASSLNSTERTILVELRLPRMISGLLVGGALGVAGVGFQSLFRNPLADPFVIGASSGAALGVTVSLVMGLQISFVGLRSSGFAALAGTVLLIVIVLSIGSLSQRPGPTSLLLAGIAISSMVNSIVSLLMYWHDDKVVVIVAWLTGSLAGNNWSTVLTTSILSLVGGCILWSLSRPLDAYLLGDVASKSLGLELTRFRVLLVMGASIATAAAVAAAGIIGFVGLIAPHIARWIVGPKHALLVPMSWCLGAILLILADSVARTIIAPAELPIGIVTALMGSPFFLGLLLFRPQRESGRIGVGA
ncbi:MAG: iron ABC transporter permease [Pirellula sp.]